MSTNKSKPNSDAIFAEARAYAKSLVDIWGDDLEQIEAHMESDGFPERVIDIVIEEISDQLMV